MWRKLRLLILGLVTASAACSTDPPESTTWFEATCDGGVCTVCTECKVDQPDPTPTPTASPVPTPTVAPTPAPTATPLPTPTAAPTPFPSPAAAPQWWDALNGDALRKSCQNPPEYPENAGETCTNQSGWGRWLMCHRKNVKENPYKGGCTKCRRWPQWVKDRCAGVSSDEPEKKIKCFIDNMQGWLGQGMPICDEASRCLMDLVNDIGWDCHREASDTHAWVVCTINGTRHVFDGNNGAYYTCK
jgi:hypothetical protein